MAVVVFALLLGGCRVESDRLYTMGLAKPPTEKDWAAALPIYLTATGGASSMEAEGQVDKDSVHKATASCHHGTAAQPIKLEARAFYTGDRLYMRVSWLDPTGDYGPAWTKEGTRWKAGSNRRDGLGILWSREKGDFNCTSTCHLRDWRKGGGRAFADYAMAADGAENDFWIWRAGRGGVSGSVEDGRLTQEGKMPDGNVEYEIPNSMAASKGKDAPGVFGEEDGPKIPGENFTPGYLIAAADPGTLEVTGEATRRDGVWTLTLSRGLKGLDPGDVTFVPGGEYSFGMAVLDGVAKDHNAVSKGITIKLVKPGEVAGGN